jgi:exodeoxyribonuclease-3
MPSPRRNLKITSWNVNGLRACAKKGFLEWLSSSRSQIVGLQEVRALESQLPDEVASPSRWHTHFAPAERKGYSGVGLYSRLKPEGVDISLGEDRFDNEGRLQVAQFGSLLVANVYFPNGSGKDRDQSRVPYKLDFYQRLFEKLETERAQGRPIIVMGDFNTAHREIDLARPKSNHKTSGFLPIERDELDRWLMNGWTDTFRHFHAGPDHYTWWSQRFGVRAKNIGWRIDYLLASPGAMPFLKSAKIHPDVQGSDHCPISATFDGGILATDGIAPA